LSPEPIPVPRLGVAHDRPVKRGNSSHPNSTTNRPSAQARVNYLAHRAPEDDRPLYISISNALSSILGILIAAILGLVAHLHDVELPIIVLTALIGIVSILAPRLLRDNA
jgi:hypothetical protein